MHTVNERDIHELLAEGEESIAREGTLDADEALAARRRRRQSQEMISIRRITPSDAALLREVRLRALSDTPWPLAPLTPGNLPSSRKNGNPAPLASANPPTAAPSSLSTPCPAHRRENDRFWA